MTKVKRDSYTGMSLSMRIGLIFFVLILLLLISMAGFLYRYFHNDVMDSLLTSHTVTVNTNAQAVDDILTRINLSMKLISDDKADFLYTLRDYSGDAFTAFHQYNRMKDMLTNIMGITLASYTSNCRLSLIVDEAMGFSRVLSGYPLSDFYTPPLTNELKITTSDAYLEEPWYQYTLEHPREDYWFTMENNPSVLNIVHTIMTPDIHQGSVVYYTVGRLVISLQSVWFDNLVAGQEKENTFALFLSDAKGRILHSTNSADAGESIYALLTMEEGDHTGVLHGQRYFVWHNALTSGLTLTSLLPCESVERLATKPIAIVLWIVSAMAVSALLLTVFLSRYSVKAIRSLARHMEQGVLEHIDPSQAHARETQTLYAAFNKQVDDICRLIADIQKTEQGRRETEMELMQAQVNPHFICNTLDSVCCRALLRNDDDLAEMLGNLSEIIRYIFRNPRETISLEQEMDIVHLYLSIQNSRSRDPIHVEEEISAECLQARMPKLLVQPILENAIMHADRTEDIRLIVLREGSDLLVCIVNHSPNLSAERINAHLRGEITLASHSTGLGVRNTHKRLELLYAGDYGLSYHDLPGHYIEAQLRIPYLNK